MAEQQEKPKDGGAVGDGGPSDDGKSLREQVTELVREILGPGNGSKPKESSPPGDIQAQVNAAVEQVRAGDAAAKEREKLEARLAALESKQTAPAAEKKPSEHRPITRKLWGLTDDEG